MAPGGGGKRKRGDRTFSSDSRDESNRPSPHRPDNLSLAQRTQQPSQPPQYGRGGYNDRGRGSRRGSRGGHGNQRSPIQSPNAVNQPQRSFSSQVSPTHAQPSTPSEPKPSAVPSTEQPNQAAVSQVEEQPEKKPKPRRPVYFYEYLTDDVLSEWEGQGRLDFESKGQSVREAEDSFTLSIIFQEILQAAMDARIDPKDAGTLVKGITGGTGEEEHAQDPLHQTHPNFAFDPASLFLDTLSIMAESTTEAGSLGPLMEATGIHPNKMRLELDSALLESFGLIRSTFVRVGIRQQTNLLYRQSNYNLLREETEGYSKLVTEFFTTSNNEPPTSEVVGETFEKVKGMIGAFDLDVGRVLDITLDVFAAVLVKQYRFFVKYLRASSWWPQSSQTQDYAAQHNLGPLPKWALPGFEGGAVTEEEREDTTASRSARDADFWTRCKEIGLAAFFELGGRRVEDSTLKAALNKSTESGTVDEDEDRQWTEITKTLPPTGNKVAAQVLGFKLRFYTSTARDPSDNLPVNLIYLAALLIKVGFISLRDLYPHIWPEDPDMEKVKEEKMKEKAEKERLAKPGGGTNALLAAGALPDDTPEGQAREAARLREAEAMRRHQRIDAVTSRSTPTVQPEEKTEELPEPADQKVQLLRSLLAIGALPEAFYMLGRFPWLPDAFPDLPIYIHRILHHCLTVVYEPLRPLQDEPALRAELSVLELEQAGAPRGSVRQEKLPPRKTLKWAQLDKDDVGEMIDYKFYWDDWADVIPVCQTVDDVFSLCSTLLNCTGLKIGQDPMLMIKISRIGSHSLASDPSDANMARWIDLSKRILVPALSLSKCNPALVNEVFELLKNFPEATRYNIYAEWYNGQTSRLPDIKAAFEQTKAETRDVLKRISKTTIKPMARALAKVSYTSPGIVFSVALSQLEAYDNIVDTFVECGRYFTFLGYDILTWSLMSALGAQGRNRLQADGLLTSKWLAVLSLFAGKIFKRFAAMNPLPIVQYVEYRLRKGNPEELVVLESMIRSMAGVISDVSFNEAQINAMSGGELLQSLTVQQLLDKRHEMKTAAKRLVKPLTESKLAGQLLVSLAQERQVCIFRVDEESAHPKLLGNVYDQIHRILGQYVELLRSSLSVKEFDLLVPDVTRLIAEFHIEPGVAFWISRPSVNAAVREFDTKHAEQQSQAMDVSKGEGESIKVDVPEPTPDKAIEDATMAIEKEDKPAEESISTAKPEEANGVDAEMDTLPNGTAAANLPNEVSTQSEDPKQSGHPVLEEIAAAIRTSLPEETWTVMSPSFYTLFWQLSLGDVMISLESYHEETRRLVSRIKAVNNDKSDPSISGANKRQKEVKALQEYHDGLMIEMKERIKTKTSAPWRKYKDHWFAGAWQQFDALNVALIEHCLFPRLVMSPVDAMYTFRMIRWLHGEGAMNFRTMGVYDQFFKEKRLTSMIFLCSAKEAECLGHFIREVLKDLSTWHAKKSFYEKEAYGPKRNLPGFAKALTSEKEVKSFLEFEDFRRILLKWHRNLNGALKTCYASGEYMHIRNAINILNHIHQYFPVVNWMGTNQLAGITELSKKESREDLKIAATSLIGALKKREKSWVLPQAFNLIEGNQQAAVNGVRSNSARPGTPQTNGDKSVNLNPKAPEFRPSPQPTTNNTSVTPKPAQGGPDAEDGEIEDAQTTEVANPKESNQPRDTPSQQTTAPTLMPAITSKPPPAEVPLKQDSMAAKPPATASTTPSQPSRPPSVPSRPDINRSSSANMPNGHHDLPNRPEPPQLRRNDGRLPQKPDDRLPAPTSRESRLQGRNGADGARDAPSSRPYDRSAPSIGPRADDRLGRPPFDDGYGRPPPRDSRMPPIDDRLNRPLGNRVASGPEPGRRDFGSGPRPRDTGMGPSMSSMPQPPIRGAVNAEAAPLNPARAALIHGHAEPDREPHSRYHGERSSHHESDRRSRGSSPVRSDDRRPMYDDRRPHQESRNGFDERLSHSRYDDPRAPTGPRTDRPSGPPSVAGDRFRDGMRPPISSAPPIESNHGRPRQDPRQSESYGRLNNNPEYNDVPSGPRMPNGSSQDSSRHGRNVNGPPQGMNNQQNSMSGPGPIPPSQARTAPGGPGSRSSPRNQPPAPTTNDGSPTDTTSPAVETTGIHPDRLKAMQGSAAPPQSSGPLPPNRGPPSNRPPLPPISAPSAGPLRGPNNQAQSPIGPSPTNRGPPTGPADRGNNNRSDKRFTGLQSVLQQNTQAPPSDRSNQGTSIRGRGGRANNGNIPSPSASGPPTPGVAPRNDPFPPPRNDDLFAGRASTHPNTVPDDDARYGNGRGPPIRGPPSEPERRSKRHGGGHRDRSPPPMNHGHSHGDHRAPPMPMRDDDRLPPPGGSGNPMRDRFRNEPHGGPPAGMNIRGNAQAGDFRGGPGGPSGPNTGGGGGMQQGGGGGGGGDMGRDFRSRDGGGGGYDRGPRGPPGGGGAGGPRNADDGGGGGSLRKRGRPPVEDAGYSAGPGEKRPRR